jgi:uncharacterized damage-inducible protein DinB
VSALLARLFAWDDWANREVTAALEGAGTPPARSVRILAHVLGAEWLWLSRLRQEEKRVPVWPEWDLVECRAQIGPLREEWIRLLDSLSGSGLGREVSYVNSKGEPWTNGAGDILLHVVFHSGYHRGQIASDMRSAAFEPAYTDFIHAVRQGKLD